MLRCIVHFSLSLISKLMALLYTPIWLYYQCRSPKKCIAAHNEILFQPAVILAKKIRLREVTSTYVVSAYINRVKEVNEVVNAVVEDRFESALEEAALVDSFIKSCELTQEEIKTRYPLLGVPMTIKESIAVADMSHNAGCKLDKPKRAVDDADAVRQLKAAGVVIILVSNTPEYCMNWETFNYVTGRTLNPYDTRRTCGGSSGGEAVLLATCGSVIGLGSDVVGSLRIPPSFCGVYGHRPTPGLVSPDGHQPTNGDDSEEFWIAAYTLGPLSRYAVDLPLLLQLILKPEIRHVPQLMTEFNPKMIKVFYMENDGSGATTRVNSEIKSAMLKLVLHAHDEGFRTKKVRIKGFSDAVDLSFIPLLSIKTYPSVFDNPEKSFYAELLRIIFCTATVTPNSIFYVWLRKIAARLIDDKRLQRNKALLEKLKQEIIDILGSDGVLIYPTFPNVAHFHGQIYSKTVDTSYLAIFASLGFPVTVCPAGLSSNGMPIGFQVVTTPYNDRLSLAFVREIERTYGGWVPPPYTSRSPV